MPADDPPRDEADSAEEPATDPDPVIVGSVISARALTIVLAVALVVALGAVVYISVSAQEATDPYTEFYILGSEGNASAYPQNLTVGEQATVTVGVVNNEQRQLTYTLAVRAANRTLTTRQLTVANGQTWERPVTYSVERPGNVTVRFLLYQGSDPDLDAPPYRSLRLRANVTRATGSR